MSTDDVYADQAKKLVDEVIETAITRLETNLSLTEREKTFESLKAEEFSRQSTFVRDDNFEVKNIKWLTISEFSVEKAEEKIHEFIKVIIVILSAVHVVKSLTPCTRNF
jgi:hypothetical protein